MDPVIPADIVLVLVITLIGGPPLWLAGRWLMARKRAQATIEDDSGDGGGHPTAGQKIIAGLEDAVAHVRGDSSRAKVTRRAGDMPSEYDF